jgi:hypothetical protein
MAKQQEQKLTFTESYQDQLCKLYSFKEEKARYRKSYIDWDKIKRANGKAIREKATHLSKDAKAILAPVIQKLEKGERVFFNHKYISTITQCKRRQNQNIIKQLESVLDITYHNSMTHEGKKYRFSYEFSYKGQTVRTKAVIGIPITLEQIIHNESVVVIPTTLEQENIASIEHSIEQFSARQNDPLYIYENKDIEDIDLESNFLQNSEDSQSTTNCHLLKIQSPEVKTPPIETVKFKKRVPNKRKKPINAERKARIYHFNQYKEPQNLKHHYPLIKEDCTKLQTLSGRDFSLNAMNEILLDMSKRLDNSFCSKAQFIAYFGKCLRYEMRDAVKTGNDNFRIKANIPKKEVPKKTKIFGEQELKAYDLENRSTNGFEQISCLGILDKLQFKNSNNN